MSGENLELFEGSLELEKMPEDRVVTLSMVAQEILSGRGADVPPELVLELYPYNRSLLIEPHQSPPQFLGLDFDCVEPKPFLFALKYDCLSLVKQFIEQEQLDPFSSPAFAQYVLYFAHANSAMKTLNYLRDRFSNAIFFDYGFDYIKQLIIDKQFKSKKALTCLLNRDFKKRHDLVESKFNQLNELLCASARAMHEFEGTFKERSIYSTPARIEKQRKVMDLLETMIRDLVKRGANPTVDSSDYPSLHYYRNRNRPQIKSLAIEMVLTFLDLKHENPAAEYNRVFKYEYEKETNATSYLTSNSNQSRQPLLEERVLPGVDDHQPEHTENKETAVFKGFELNKNYSAPRRQDEKAYDLLRYKVDKTALKVSHNKLDKIKALAETFPNFERVVDDVVTHLHIPLCTQEPLKIEPMLLIGSPGIGKTEFINSLCRILGVEKVFISGAAMSSNFTLSGMEPGWSGARPGIIADTLMQSENINFILYLDEIEKVIQLFGNGGNPLSALFDLLEPSAARKFQDQYYRNKASFNAQYVSCIASGNSLEGIDSAIQSRFMMYDIPSPSLEQKRVIIQSIYQRLIREKKLDSLLASKLPEVTIDGLIAFEPRQVVQAIHYGLGSMLRSKTRELRLENISSHLIHQLNKHQPNKLGFV